MSLTDRGDLASLSTVGLSGFGLFLHHANAWASEFMPLFTAFGIVSGAFLTAWYYYQSINQKRRDRALAHKQMEHEKELAEMRLKSQLRPPPSSASATETPTPSHPNNKIK